MSAFTTLLLGCVLGLGACRDTPHEAADAGPGDSGNGREPTHRVEPDVPVDVGDHGGIAARASVLPIRVGWDWGVVPVGVAVAADGSVYWSQFRSDSIERVDAKGGNRVTVANASGPLGLAIDRRTGRLFFASDRTYPRAIGFIEPDGRRGTLISGADLNCPFAVAYASTQERLVWSETIHGRIRTLQPGQALPATIFDDGIANFHEVAGVEGAAPVGVAVATQTGWVFWSDLRNGKIWRSRLDGSERRVVLDREQGIEVPTGLAVDETGGKLYWADAGAEVIGRSDFSGLEVETVVTAVDGVLEPWGVAFDEGRRLLYWTDVGRNGVYRVDPETRRSDRFVDLNAPAPATPRIGAAPTCRSLTDSVRSDFLHRLVKRLRVCVLSAKAVLAVVREPHEVKGAALVCRKQLDLVREIEVLRTEVSRHCSPARTQTLIDALQERAGRIVAADLSRTPVALRAIHPFLVRDGERSSAAATLVAGILTRLATTPVAGPGAVRQGFPVTGQETSYTAVTRMDGEAAPIPDDGTLRTGLPFAWIDNGDGTISDRNTGLMWEKKCDDCQPLHDVHTRYVWQPQADREGIAEWLDSINRENGAGYAGYSDWRLPEVEELLGLLDFERINPAVGDAFHGEGCGLDCDSPTDPACSCTALGTYWSSGNTSGSGEILPVVAFHLGIVVGERSTGEANVRAVRGPRILVRQRFVDNRDGTITDRVTGLMWEKKIDAAGDLHSVHRAVPWSFDGTAETAWDWIDAVNRERDGGFAGYSDWRIPNVKELYSLVDLRRAGRSVDAAFDRGTCGDRDAPTCSATAELPYWTSTTFADFPSLALVVNFAEPRSLADLTVPEGILRVSGGVEPHEKTALRGVRAVRGPVAPRRLTHEGVSAGEEPTPPESK